MGQYLFSTLWDAEVFLRLFLASLFGLMVGVERFAHGRPAGMRTNLLVCLASAAVMVMPERFFTAMDGQAGGGLVLDPSRIAAGAITGIGFLGAGVIVKTRASVHGLTTAACIWLVSVIGLALGAGQYGLALMCLILTIVFLTILRMVEEYFGRLTFSILEITLPLQNDTEKKIKDLLSSRRIKYKLSDQRTDIRAGERTISYLLQSGRRVEVGEIVRECQGIPNIIRVSLRHQVIE